MMTKQEFHEQIGFIFGAGCMFIGVAFELFAMLADQVSRVLHRVADGLTEYALQVIDEKSQERSPKGPNL